MALAYEEEAASGGFGARRIERAGRIGATPELELAALPLEEDVDGCGGRAGGW